MIARSALIVAVLVLCCVQNRALPVRLTPVRVIFDWPANTPASTAKVHIHAARMVGDTMSVVPVEADAGPEGSVLDLGEGVWQVQAFAAGYWSQGVEVTVGGQTSASARVAFWPAATLQGEIAAAPGETPPQALTVTLSARQTPDHVHAELNCEVDRGRWSCTGPAGVFDVKIETPGYAPQYDWSISLKAAENTDLGQIELQRALSVFGRAVGKDGSDPPGPCLATLQPDAARRGGPGPAPENTPPDEKTLTVPVNQQGYFQIAGVMPGLHALDVQCLTASGFRELQVQPNGETRVDAPLVLEDLTLDIAITPKTDPAGQPWQLTIDATSPRLRRIADSAVTSVDGHWIRRGLIAGSYRVAVSSSDGMQWLKKDFELRPDTGPLALHLASVSLAGKVLLSGQPVRARLAFSNQDGGEPVTLNSDDQGSFTGLLPIAPGAQETMWAVEAHVAHPETVRRLEGIDVPTVATGRRAWLDLELPAMPVHGIAVSEDGEPQNGAQVTFEAAGSGYRTTASTDSNGSFEMADLPPGKYNAVAESSYGLSDSTPFAIVDGTESKLKLTMHPYLRTSFYVVSKDKEPIPDATVQVWLAPGVPRALGRTNQYGRFEASLPPGTTEVGLTVGASDYALKLIKMPVSSAPDTSEEEQALDGQATDQNSIALSTNGGTLVLNFEPVEGSLDRSATLYLVHNGAIADARTLDGWGTNQAGAHSDGPAEVDGIEPGDYALCVVTDPSQLTILWQGTVPPQSCTIGTVKSGQTLTLTPQVLTATSQ
jgi:Carboxypeptidase regulatory-like domain